MENNKIKIKIKKKDLAAIIIAIPHIFDFDDFTILTGFSFDEVRSVIDKLNDIVFTYEYMVSEEFELEMDIKKFAILDSIVGQTLFLVRWKDNIFFRSKNINFEELEKIFEPVKDDIEEFYKSEK